MAGISQRVVWTVLPNGVKEGGAALKLSVLVSPRLSLPNNVSPDNLSHFADWSDWPKVIGGATFGVSVDGGPATPATRVSKLDSAIWKAIFPAATFVRPYKFDDMRDKVILSYPVATIANAIQSIYGEVGGTAGGELPSRRDLRIAIYGRDFPPTPRSPEEARPVGATTNVPRGEPAPRPLEPREVLALLRADKKRADVVLRKSKRPRYEGVKAALGGASQIYGPDKALDLFAFYHRPLQKEVTATYTKKGPNDPHENTKWKSAAKTAMPSANSFKDEIDFHQLVSSLVQYNELSKLCGLIIDLEIPATAVAAGLHKLRLSVNWPKAGGQVTTEPDILPIINADRKPAEFLPAKELPASAISGRYLRLEGSGFDLVQLDVDGAGMKVKNLAANLTLKDPDPPINEDSFSLEDKEPDKTGLPSLRTAGLMLAQERRDLAIQALLYRNSALQDAINGGQPVDELFAEDTIRGYRVDVQDVAAQKWNSLYYRNIDFKLVNTGGAHSTKAEEGMARLAASESTDGSEPDLLKLHEGLFSWKGWSLAAPEPGKIIAHDDAAVVDQVATSDEATPPGLPLKTTYEATPKTLPSLRFGRRYRVRVRLVDLAGASAPFTPSDAQPVDAVSNVVVYRRHEPVEAPALALVQSGAVEGPGDGESMGYLAIRTMNETPNLNSVPINGRARRHVAAPRTSHRFAEHHSVLDTAGGHIDPGLYAQIAGQDSAIGETIINMPGPPPALTPTPTTFAVAPESFKLPYLPDPLALGVAIRIFGVAGINSNTVFKVPFYGSVFDPLAKPAWPKAEPFTIVLEDKGVNDAKFDPTTREFRIILNKAERAWVRLSCLMPKSALAYMAVAEMIRNKKGAAALAAAVPMIEDGRHWMFTPWRTIVLTHAVQKPLVTPAFPNPIPVARSKGQVEAYPNLGKFPLSSKSTTRIDLHARWVEPVDNPAAGADPEAAGPVTRNHTAVAATLPVGRLEAPGDVMTVRQIQHVFSDTRYRRVLYKLDATTRFREFMAPAIRGDETKLKVTSNEQVGWVRNSAPPPQPDLLYVMPTFGWNRNESGDKKTSLRSGGGIRVYLDRPWFSTGFTEMLGVMLPPSIPAPSEADLDKTYKKSVTMWGADPIWAGGAVQLVSPPKSAFPLARWKAPISFDGTGLPAEEGTDLPTANFEVDNLVHPEDSQLKLTAAPHAVGYDPDRRLYYCDIVVTPPRDAYFPFIRLAIARYNPLSTPGAHLSPILLTEFQQLTPDRLAIVTRQGPQKVHAAVYGPTVPTQRWGQGRLPITGVFGVEIQVLDAGADPDLGWRKVEAPPPAPGNLSASAAAPSARVSPSSRAITAAPSTRASPPAAAAPQTAPAASRSVVSPSAVREVDDLVAAGKYAELVARQDLTLAWQRPLLWEGDINLPLVAGGARRRLMIVEAEVYQSGDASSAVAGGVRPGIGGRVVYFETIDV